MRPRLLSLIERVRYSFWFVPSLMVAGAAGLAAFMDWVDERQGEELAREIGLVYTGGPEGARELLSIVAGSMITVAGVVFSITIVALTLASSQFGPRLLRNFVRDPGNQITLGTFLATFVYCLLVVRTIRGTDDLQYVPQASVTVAVALALASLGVLIYFIHHAAMSIQGPNVIDALSRDLERAIDELFPEELGVDAGVPEADASTQPFPADVAVVCASRTGYVQAIEDDALMQLAAGEDVVVEILRRPGEFVLEGKAVARVAPSSRCDDGLRRRVRGVFVVAEQRSVEQDVGFAFEQLVSVCVRALSPGVNDPVTAIQCIERIGAGLSRLARRKLPSAWRLDARGEERVLARPVTLPEVLDAVYGLIRPFACSNAPVTVRMLQMLEIAAGDARRLGDRDALADHARILERQALASIGEERDRVRVREQYEAVRVAIAAGISPRASARSGRGPAPPPRWRPAGS